MRTVTDALVIRRADYKDYDRMVTLITPRMGKIDANARGSRRIKSPLANCAELFTAGEYTLFEKNGRYVIEQCRITESYYPLRTDYDRLVTATYYLRLLDMASQPDLPNEELFQLALRSLAYLCYSELPPQMLTMAFELRLLANGGIAPRVDTCVVCSKPLKDRARFDAFRGGCTCMTCSRSPEISIEARRLLYKLPRTAVGYEEKLTDADDWASAARFTRSFIADRFDLRPEYYPPLP